MFHVLHILSWIHCRIKIIRVQVVSAEHLAPISWFFPENNYKCMIIGASERHTSWGPFRLIWFNDIQFTCICFLDSRDICNLQQFQMHDGTFSGQIILFLWQISTSTCSHTFLMNHLSGYQTNITFFGGFSVKIFFIVKLTSLSTHFIKCNKRPFVVANNDIYRKTTWLILTKLICLPIEPNTNL